MKRSQVDCIPGDSMRYRYILLALLLAACSSQPATAPDTFAASGDAAETSSVDASGECGPERPCPDRLVCEQGYCVRPVADAGRDSGPVDTGRDADDTAPVDTGADTTADTAPADVPDVSDGGMETADSGQADTRPHWDAGVDCQESTVCCGPNGQTKNSGEPCGKSRGSSGETIETTPRYRCQQGACRACECSEGGCCDGCFFKARGEWCRSKIENMCAGGSPGTCGGQLVKVTEDFECTGYSAECPDTPVSQSTAPIANPCEADRECRIAPNYPCKSKTRSQCSE